MRTLGLVLALLVVGSGMCAADTVTVDIYSAWNYFACPLVPFDPAPDQVMAGVDIDGRLFRFDAPTQSMIVYDMIDPSAFGNVLLGDGYILDNYAATPSFSYSGVPDGVPDGNWTMTDMWISLPGYQLDQGSNGGWHLFAHPFKHDTPVNGPLGSGDNIWFTDGTTLKTWDEAVNAGWVDSAMSYFDGATQSQLAMTYQGWGNDDTLRAKSAYWIETKKDNIALIIPAYNP